MKYDIEIEQIKTEYLEIEAESEEEAEDKAREEFGEMLAKGLDSGNEEINIRSIDWEEEDEN